jgi:hypothetical protein
MHDRRCIVSFALLTVLISELIGHRYFIYQTCQLVVAGDHWSLPEPFAEGLKTRGRRDKFDGWEPDFWGFVEPEIDPVTGFRGSCRLPWRRRTRILLVRRARPSQKTHMSPTAQRSVGFRISGVT